MKSFFVLLGVAISILSSDLTITDFSGASNLYRATQLNTTMSPEIDSVRYVNLISADTLISGSKSSALNQRQAAWPMLTSTSENRFKFSYIWFCEPVTNVGNYMYEKDIELLPSLNSIAVTTAADPIQAHRDSMGLLVTRRILQTTGQRIGGMNSKGFSLSNGRHLRLCQGWGGTRDSVYIIDTTDNSGTLSAVSLLDSLIQIKTYPDYCINKTEDTLFVVFSPNNSRIVVSPIRLVHPNSSVRGTPLHVLNDGGDRKDFGIARDKESGIFAITALRVSGSDTTVELSRLSPSFSVTHTMILQNGLPRHQNDARNISVVSLGENKFAVSYFLSGTNGTYLKVVDLTNDITVHSTVTLDNSRSLIPNICYRSGKLAAVWLKDISAAANNSRVYGKIFTIENGLISDTIYSGPVSVNSAITESYFNLPANYRLGVSLDDYGNLVAAFVNQTNYRLYLSALVPTFFFADTGYFSIKDSIPENGYGSLASDSIKYSSFSAVNSGYGNAELLLRVSSDNNFSGPYLSVSGATNTDAYLGHHYEYRIRMLTGVSPTEGPRIGSAAFSYNVKPTLASIDSYYVNGSTKSLSENDTISLLRGTDSLRLYFSARDYDNASFITYHVNGYIDSSNVLEKQAAYSYSGSININPNSYARDTVYRLSFSVVDTNGWGSDSFHLFVNLHNAIPKLTARALGYDYRGSQSIDTMINYGDTIFVIDSGYSVIRSTATDSNNVTVTQGFFFNGNGEPPKTGALVYSDTVYADSILSIATVFISVDDPLGGRDSLMFYLRVSHLPFIDSVYYQNGSGPIAISKDSSSIRLLTLFPDTFIIKANDPDIFLDDMLTFSMSIDGAVDTSCTVRDSVVRFFRAANRGASRIVLSVSDQSSASDSTVITLIYPAVSAVSYAADSVYLIDSLISYPVRRRATIENINASTKKIALASSGTDTVTIGPISFKKNGGGGYFRVGASMSRSAAVALDSIVNIRRVAPNDTLFITIRDSVAIPYFDSARINLSAVLGDTVVRDTLQIYSNDPYQNTLEYAIKLTVKEPPFIVQDSLRSRGSNKPLFIVYSEPMQRTDTALAGIVLYSLYDSLRAALAAGMDTTPAMPCSLWFSKEDSSRFDTLFISPLCSTYSYTSLSYSVSPKDGFFIATDIIRLSMSSALRDEQGNYLDLDNNYMPDFPVNRKIFTKVMDSSGMRISAVSPESNSISEAPVPRFSVTFSSPLLVSSIDTSLVNNRSIRIISAAFPNSPFPLLAAPVINGRELSFRTAGGFPGSDTVTVTISASVNDSMGNTLDANMDGRGGFFDLYGTAGFGVADTFITSHLQSGGDNYSWIFYTAPQDFYLFPVPYEPNKNSRHASQGGVIFKNIHTVAIGKGNISGVDILIFSADGKPVYSTAKTKETITIAQGLKPSWKWRAVNSSGKDVASGLYLYCIVKSATGEVLKKGKLVVIR